MSTPKPAAPDRQPSIAARAAGLAFLPLALVPFLPGLGTVLRDPNRPGSGCFEYCAADSDGGRIALVLGSIGILVTVLIWRRHLAAMALALFMTSVITAFWAVTALIGILTEGFYRVFLVYLAIGLAVVLLDALLVAAMRVEMDRAGRRAAASVPITSGSGERPA